MTPNRTFLVLIASGALAGIAEAQQIPGPEGGPQVVISKLVNGEPEVRDADSGAPIVMPKTVGLWCDKNGAGSVQPGVEFQAQPAGYDIIYTFTNNTKHEQLLGAINAGIFTLGPKITFPDLCTVCQPVSVDYNTYHVQQMLYPQSIYSPAWILENKDYAVGVSLQYPILDYKHDVRLCLYSPTGRFADGEGGRGWRLEFLLSNVGNETPDNKLYNSGSIKPGESRTYVVSVRVTKKPQEWVRTLVPYRNWFRSEYGGVEYLRDPRPINGRNFTTNELCSDANPFGFGDSRPDVKGWGKVVDGLMERSGWGTLLFWTTSGSYRYNDNNNMPFQFATNWNATPAFATAYDPKIGFPRIPAAGQPIGFWWGRSCQVANKWDDNSLEPFDPHNKAHRAAEFAEMDLAVKAGATTIGLDTFSSRFTPVWDLVSWIDDLKARYPGVRFCAEPVTCDLIHRKIPTYYRGHNDRTRVKTPQEIDAFYNPHYLADFLLPGHEIWGAFRWCKYTEWFGITFTEQQEMAQLQKIASLGYTPVCLADLNLSVKADAAKSWEFTVPEDLREDGNGGGGNGGLGNGDQGGNGPNNDPFPTFDLFQKAFNAGDMRADLNGDGRLDFFDYTAWQNAHAAGNKNGGNNQAQGGKGGGANAGGANAGAAKPGAITAGKQSAKGGSAPRMQISVTPAPKGNGGIVGSAGNGAQAKGGKPSPDAGRAITAMKFMSSPLSFTSAEVAAALARARGLDAPDTTTAGVPDDNN